MSERCPTCDRVDCPIADAIVANAEAASRYPAISQERWDAAWAVQVARRDCSFHAVDWRARALKAEAALDAALPSSVGQPLSDRAVLIAMAEEYEAIPDGERTRLDILRAETLRRGAVLLGEKT